MSAPASPAKPQMIVWWVLWFAITNGLVILRVFLPAGEKAAGGIVYVALFPLFVSAILRIFVLPRFTERAKALPLFVAGLASAEACGIIGLVLGGPGRDTFVAVALLMLIAYAPVFAAKYPR